MAQASRSSVTFKLGRKRLHTFVELREPVDVAEEATPKGEVSDALATSADARLRSRRLQDEGNTIAESTGDWHKALLSWQRALELTPQRPELHETMAQAYLQLGDFWKAIACAERALQGCLIANSSAADIVKRLNRCCPRCSSVGRRVCDLSASTVGS